MRDTIAVLVVCATLSAQESKEVLDDAFARLDDDRDGRIERREFPGSDRQYQALSPGDDGIVTREEFGASPFGRRLVAARTQDASLPRRRTDQDALLGPRIDAALRLDGNRDGKVTRTEWATGDELAFSELDLDGDGDIDRADRVAARRRAPSVELDRTLPDISRFLEDPARLVGKLDRNDDGALDADEVRLEHFADAFGWADRDRDGRLSPDELQRLARAAAEQIAANNRGNASPRAYRVPFSTWDRNDDRRLETAEWQGPKYLFARIDQDRDAALTTDEVARYVRSVEGMTFLDRFDLNDDGRVTIDEFAGPPGAFRRADRNGDGVVTRADR